MKFIYKQKVAKRGAKHHERLPTHATRQSPHYHESLLPSIVAKQLAAPTSHGKTPTTHHKMSDQRARSSRLQQVIVAELKRPRKEQLRLPAKIPRPARGDCRASKAEDPAVGEGEFDPRHRCRTTSPDAAAPTSRCRTRRLASTGRREAEDIRRRRHHSRDEFPQRRLQEGYDAKYVAVTCPGKDWVFTRGKHGWGHKNTTPPTRKTAHTGVAVAKAFARGVPSTNIVTEPPNLYKIKYGCPR